MVTRSNIHSMGIWWWRSTWTTHGGLYDNKSLFFLIAQRVHTLGKSYRLLLDVALSYSSNIRLNNSIRFTHYRIYGADGVHHHHELLYLSLGRETGPSICENSVISRNKSSKYTEESHSTSVGTYIKHPSPHVFLFLIIKGIIIS